MSGGLTWPGFLATQLNTTLTYAYVFAVAGATVDNTIVPAYSSSVPSISDQVRTWTANLQPKPAYAPWTADDALAAVWIGVNDVGNSYSQSGEEARLDKDLDRYFALLATLYAGGIRNFALLNIPRKYCACRTGMPLLTSRTSNAKDPPDEGAVQRSEPGIRHRALERAAADAGGRVRGVEPGG